MLDARESDDLQYECLNAALDKLVESRREDALALIEMLQAPLALTTDLKCVYDGLRSAGMTVESVRVDAVPRARRVIPADLAKRLTWLVHAWPPVGTLSPVQRTQRAELLAWAPRARCRGPEFSYQCAGCGEKLPR